MKHRFRAFVACAGLAGFTVGAQAGTVTLDFESFTSGAPTSDTLIEDGFFIDQSLAPSGPAIIQPATHPDGKALAFCGWCAASEGVSIYALSGVNFELDSFLTFSTGDNYTYTGWVTGYLQGGGTVTQFFDTDAGLVLFDQTWVNLSSVDIVFTTNRLESDFTIPAIDNITLQAVPVPAAVWLFSSALAGLGWLRRRGR